MFIYGDCEHRNNIYLGMTTRTLSRRLTMHLASGGPKQLALDNYNLPLTRADLVNNTKILLTEFNHNKLSITEALSIYTKNATIH